MSTNESTDALDFNAAAAKWILIADEKSTEQQALVTSLRSLAVQNPIRHVLDGHEAIRYLNGDSPFTDLLAHPFPAILFLNLNLRVVSGWDVLEWLTLVSGKRDSNVFVYAAPLTVAQVQSAYALGADFVSRSPADELELVNLMHLFPKHWEFASGHDA
ncbi:MAG: CheY-like response regulator receiver domain protein [Verrucomicrobiales bacterium]|nr:CheY-like response regulator receiver domain protein [Verrucomicrobiales bacterium]